MRKILLYVNSLFGGAIFALFLAVAACLVLMVTTPEAGVRNEGLFGAVFFGSMPSPDGSVSLSLGINSWPSLVIVWLVCSIFIFAVVEVVRRLQRYRKSLIDASKPH